MFLRHRPTKKDRPFSLFSHTHRPIRPLVKISGPTVSNADIILSLFLSGTYILSREVLFMVTAWWIPSFGYWSEFLKCHHDDIESFRHNILKSRGYLVYTFICLWWWVTIVRSLPSVSVLCAVACTLLLTGSRFHMRPSQIQVQWRVTKVLLYITWHWLITPMFPPPPLPPSCVYIFTTEASLSAVGQKYGYLY